MTPAKSGAFRSECRGDHAPRNRNGSQTKATILAAALVAAVAVSTVPVAAEGGPPGGVRWQAFLRTKQAQAKAKGVKPKPLTQSEVLSLIGQATTLRQAGGTP